MIMDFKIRVLIKTHEREIDNLRFIDDLEQAGILEWDIKKIGEEHEYLSFPLSHYIFRPDIDWSSILDSYNTITFLQISSLSKWSERKFVHQCYIENGVTGERQAMILKDLITYQNIPLSVIPLSFYVCSRRVQKEHHDAFCYPLYFRRNVEIDIIPEKKMIVFSRTCNTPIFGQAKPKIYIDKLCWRVDDTGMDDDLNVEAPTILKTFFRCSLDESGKKRSYVPTLIQIAHFYALGGLDVIGLSGKVKERLENGIKRWIRKKFYGSP